jgi:hypothetical protein
MCLLAGGISAIAADEPPLAGLPSPAGPHLEQIAALDSGQWLCLGPPAADPQHGLARGRTWSSRMAYAPDVRAAFLYGEGVHGWFNEETRRYMDDLWAYDVQAHRWIAVYPGAHVDELSLKLDEHGFEVDATGQPIPVAQLGHGYEMVAYDTGRRKFLAMPCPADYWHAALGARRMTWFPGGEVAARPVDCSPWAYDVASGRWELQPAEGDFPDSSFGDVLVYLPQTKNCWFRRGELVWYYDFDARRWTRVEPAGPPPPFGIDPVAAFDPIRNRIWMGGGGYPESEGPHALWAYDLATDAWVDPQPRGTPCLGDNRYGCQQAAMNYDTAADKLVLLVHRDDRPEINGVYVYDPAANAWTEEPAAYPPELDVRQEAWSSFYAPEVNAHFLHIAGDSQDNGVMWVYRQER